MSCQHRIVIELTVMCNYFDTDSGDDTSNAAIDMQIQYVINRIKEERKAAQLSQMDLSFKAGLSQNLINYIESGKRTPNLDTLLKICKALNINPACLFASDEAKRREARESIIALVREWV
ncbi:MAG: hypothetical protein Ta2A_01100 [Treponemataceae bacterium]|nr:MAG: hypothetical protein Ta2A_01100 [Treponemataceae bacterium]